MPILVNTEELEPGMVLASNIINKYSVLLSAGHKLTNNDIKSLVRQSSIHTAQVVDPLLDQLVEFDDNSNDLESSLKVRRTMATVSGKVSGIVKSSTAVSSENIAGMQQTIEEMIQFMADSPVSVAFLEQGGDSSEYLQEHSANVFYLSMLLGNTIKNYIKRERERLSAAKSIKGALDLAQLASAALFHDVGLMSMEHLLKKPGPLTQEEYKLVQEHPVTGADMLPDNIGGMAKLAIRCHHENYCGTGYPSKLSGDTINVFSRIIRVADAYCAATASSVYKRAKSPIIVLHEMLNTDYSKLYDPVILDVFISIMQPLPIGAKLVLDSGRIAVVTKHSQKAPFNPQVIIVFDEYGRHLPEDKFDGPFFLNARDDVIVKSFGEDDISFINSLKQDTFLPDLSEQVDQDHDDLLSMIYP